ncbi:CPBP family intramembrane glutamic endopeptidase [Dyella caseinilytica]|uniref:CPBP family intramembrane metalloprotease n=1 Tax=Dyella caseinilytica TaxID=1849581 RepID=A0ABX7GY84_9GAMM|nr:CPBP family intramembrane glutamic endopeptidase [Dyella caseinilytica]QRN55416.1 CPBP family intramembrane metalloprotease [Dyella caseinilytica]
MIDLPTLQRLKRFSSESARLAFYRRGVIGTWIVTGVTVSLAPLDTLLVTPRHPGDLPWLDGRPLVFAPLVAVIALLFLWILWPSIKCLFDKGTRKTYLKAYRSSFIRFMLPVSRRERAWWVLLSVTAGACEELLYRGFLLQYLRGHLAEGPSLALLPAWLLSSLAFGIGHIYQGKQGVIETTTAGLVFGMLAILSGNLILPILIHIVVDLRILLIYNPAEDDPANAQALIRGFNPRSD